MRLIYLPLCMATLMLCGCDKNTQGLDEKEERNPLVRQAYDYIESKDWDKAETAFKQALENNPGMARPHLDLALIYQQHKVNYINAIYHFDRYLELRPDAEKAEMIREQMAKAEKALANHYILESKDVKQVVAQYNRVQQENTELKRQIAALKKPTSSQSTAVALAPIEPKLIKRTVIERKPNPHHRIYTVVAGDTLTGIAKKLYGNDDYEPIYQANKDRMKSRGDLRVGQTLVIPKK